MIMPMIGQPISTTIIPPKNEALAFILCLWKKKLRVLFGPITHDNPLINKIYREIINSEKCSNVH